MKTKLFSMLAVSLFTATCFAQSTEEPEFVGEAMLVNADQSHTLLEKQLTQSRTAASTGLMLTGIGKVRTQLQIDGCCSGIVLDKNKEVKLIIRGVDNLTDPLSIVRIFKFEKRKKYRRAELAAVNNFGGAKRNNLDYVSFTGKKYGTSSYLINIPTLESGEYGITISNPNALDEKQTVVSTFAVAE
ncbi:hypothetical protein GV828_00165 [Flavobacterium sp. NST-5]|uniref:Uncharacterized protein n=1 Tax=Flavobacterium ichthyis TaxID=2698827 RepID=A0ABW9Z5T6_9FLAO|nr:hypothetical protein [Flavobacterium ichthyis]NBL63611.1 hypothetical protein [Flavobacterium ichthyis]